MSVRSRFVPAVASPASLLFLIARGAALAVVTRRLLSAARQPAPLAAASDHEPGAATQHDERRISVVVPARNEALRLGPLLGCLAEAPGVCEVIVVDDESTDDTASIARAASARVVRGGPLAAGWAGKAWALQQGIDAADTASAWIVTLDADTRPSPLLANALVARMEAEGVDFATVAGSFECPTAGVGWLHPAMLTTLVYRFGAPGSQRRPDRLLANGQCMGFRRGTVQLDVVAGHVVEDVALARSLAGSGRKVAMYTGPDLLVTRMFEDLGDTWRGWGRSLALPGVEPRPRQLGELALLIATLVVPPARLLARRGDVVDLAALAMRLGTLGGTRRSYRQVGPVYWLSPLADPCAVAAVAVSTLRRSNRWRGRSYP